MPRSRYDKEILYDEHVDELSKYVPEHATWPGTRFRYLDVFVDSRENSEALDTLIRERAEKEGMKLGRLEK